MLYDISDLIASQLFSLKKPSSSHYSSQSYLYTDQMPKTTDSAIIQPSLMTKNDQNNPQPNQSLELSSSNLFKPLLLKKEDKSQSLLVQIDE